MKYVVLGCAVRFVVSFLLLSAANLLTGKPAKNWRCLMGAGVLWGGTFLGGYIPTSGWLGALCYILGLNISALMVFPKYPKAIMLSALLSIVVDAAAVGFSQHPVLSLALVVIIFWVVLQFRQRAKELVAIQFGEGDSNLSLTALYDSGNQLRDPVTGKSVLVVDAKAAQKLTGLSPKQLLDPVGTMGAIPGLRLIPYKTVGNTGFLLGMRFYDVKIGKTTGSPLVAFSPQSMDGGFQALLGGVM